MADKRIPVRFIEVLFLGGKGDSLTLLPEDTFQPVEGGYEALLTQTGERRRYVAANLLYIAERTGELLERDGKIIGPAPKEKAA